VKEAGVAKEPDVSVIVPAYKVENYVERAVQSALRQEWVSLEVLVIDDCSPDRTLEVASNIPDPRVKVISTPANGGPSAARNLGIEVARGRWIALLDGDDAYQAGRLRKLLDRAEKAQAEIAVDNLLIVPEEGCDPRPMFPEDYFGDLEELCLSALIWSSIFRTGQYPLHCTKPIFLRSFLTSRELTYDPSIRNGEDYLFLLEALANGARCVVEQSAGYLYTRRRGSISHRIPASDWNAMLECDRKFLERYPLEGDALLAQRERTKFIREMKVFEEMVEALKKRDLPVAAKLALSHPLALRRFVESIRKRWQKVFP
jgi:succinoglycan biosynthesis protein ExoO